MFKNNKKRLRKKVEYSLLRCKSFLKIIKNFCFSTNANDKNNAMNILKELNTF